MDEKLTPHRQVVLDVIRASHDHPTAKQVFERALKVAPKLSFATVYNALNHLAEAGSLRLIRFGDDALRYDPMLDRHDHLMCRVCGRIIDVMEAPTPSLPRGFTPPEGFEVEEITLHIMGLCGACRGKSPQGK
jgi:Fur family peroxide stress response transcriptional regulator